MTRPTIIGYYQCGLCDYTMICQDPGDIQLYTADKTHIRNHYTCNHAENIGTWVDPGPPEVAYTGYWEFGPISDDIGPKLYIISEDGPEEPLKWSEVY